MNRKTVIFGLCVFCVNGNDVVVTLSNQIVDSFKLTAYFIRGY